MISLIQQHLTKQAKQFPKITDHILAFVGTTFFCVLVPTHICCANEQAGESGPDIFELFTKVNICDLLMWF